MKKIMKKIIYVNFVKKSFDSEKVKDQCHLTGEHRGRAPHKSNDNITQDQSFFIRFVFHNFSIYDCHLFFEKLVDKKNDEVKLKILPMTNEEYFSIRYDGIRFFDSFRFLSSRLNKLVETLVDNSHKTLKDLEEEIVDNDDKNILLMK